MNVVISPKVSQESARMLADKLNWHYINPYEKEIRDFRKYDRVFNYGFSRDIKYKEVINNPKEIQKSRDKLFCLNNINVNKVEVTQELEIAMQWIKDDIVVARSLIKGDNGKGITYCTTEKEILSLEDTKCWTKYLHHTNEYRINVFKNKILSIYDKQVKNGFFKFTLLPKIQNSNRQAVELVNSIYNVVPLDWMGIDVLRTEEGILYLLEVNSAPVLFPYTLNKLVDEIKNEEI